MNNRTLSFSKEQLIQIVASIKSSGESYQSLFQVFLEAMMLAEREEYKLEKDDIRLLQNYPYYPFERF